MRYIYFVMTLVIIISCKYETKKNNYLLFFNKFLLLKRKLHQFYSTQVVWIILSSEKCYGEPGMFSVRTNKKRSPPK